MDSHKVSWFSYVPGYTDLRDYFLNGQIWGTPDYPEMIAQHIYGAIFVILFLALGAFATRRTYKNGPVPASRFGVLGEGLGCFVIAAWVGPKAKSHGFFVAQFCPACKSTY